MVPALKVIGAGSKNIGWRVLSSTIKKVEPGTLKIGAPNLSFASLATTESYKCIYVFNLNYVIYWKRVHINAK